MDICFFFSHFRGATVRREPLVRTAVVSDTLLIYRRESMQK
jgi:hypothetical protein